MAVLTDVQKWNPRRALAAALNAAASDAEMAGHETVDLAAMQAQLAERAAGALDELRAAIAAARGR